MDAVEREGRELLSPLRDAVDPAPGPSGVSVTAALSAGRRRVRTRRALGAAAAAVAVAAVVVPVSLLRGTAEPPPAAQTPIPAVAPSLFDSAARAVTVGSAGGFTPDGFQGHRDRQRFTLRLASPGAGDRGDAIIEIYPGDPPTWNGAQAPRVHEGRAFWPAKPVLRSGATELAWEWKPGSWAVVSVTGTRADQDNVHRVAQSVLPA